MHSLPEALARVEAGWSPQTHIVQRAALMCRHAEAGNIARAEEYAVEIEALQRAKLERDVRAWGEHFGPASRVMPCWAESEWKIAHAAWGRRLVHGYLVGRGVWAAAGWAAENVAAEANRVSAGNWFTAADMIAPAMLMKGAA